jgi:NAD(P)-dependent dehydrogenase (short-subunit alcohol dehydrogenase family)
MSTKGVSSNNGGNVSNKVALITGGTVGIGRASVVAFAKHGYTTIFCGRREAEGIETQRLAEAAGGQSLFVQADVCREADIELLMNRALGFSGRIDAAFNNAGITGKMGPTAAQSREDWESVLSVNVVGTWLCMKYQIQAMLAQGGGAIVNMSSVSGVWGTPGLSAYVASKHAVLGLTKTAAIEYAEAGIRINAVAPAGIMTDIIGSTLAHDPTLLAKFTSAHPLGRLGTVDEVAEAVVWLCSDAASFITGHTMMIDGGATAGVNPFK